MTELTPVLKQYWADANGFPLSGGQLFSYAAGTTTPQPTYTDSSGLTANTNPVILDSKGMADVWMAELAYKFVLKDSNGVTIWTVDNVLPLGFQFKFLNFLPYSYPTRFSFLNGQSATPLTGESFDGAIYSSVRYEYEIKQGTTIFTNGVFYLQYVNNLWQLVMADSSDTGLINGVTFSIIQVTTVAQLYLAEAGLGNGSVSFKKSWHLQSP